MAENYFGKTDTGKQRDNNEDTFIAEAVKGGKYIAACVIDGVGGYEGGEVAADIARETVLNYLQSNSGDPLAIMKDALATANVRIYNERSKNKDRQSMACVLTLALVDINNNEFFYTHVGDTRLYLFRDGSLVKITKDHSFVGFLEDSKRLSEDAAMNHPKRNEINKALGFDPQMSMQEDYIEAARSPFLPGDTILLCSDGLTDLVPSSGIVSVLKSQSSLEEKCDALITAANNAGGKDNITIVLVHNDKKPATHKATKPVLVKKKVAQQEQPVSEQKKEAEPLKGVTHRKRSNGLLYLFIFLTLLLAAAVAWLWMNRDKQQVKPVITSGVVMNPEQQKLVNEINATADSVLINDSLFKLPISISDTIFIEKDTLRIIGNGATLVADSAFKGPVFMLGPNCRYIVLEDLLLQGFDIAIAAPANALVLKNTRFIDCRLPVLAQYYFPGQVYVNGRLTDSLFSKDSLKK